MKMTMVMISDEQLTSVPWVTPSYLSCHVRDVLAALKDHPDAEVRVIVLARPLPSFVPLKIHNEDVVYVPHTLQTNNEDVVYVPHTPQTSLAC